MVAAPPDYAAIATAYAEDVVKGRVKANRWVKLACQQHLKRLKAKRSRWCWDEDEIFGICAFAESLPHVRGQWDEDRLTLEPWQVFFLASIFGWRDRRTGLRKHREAVLIVPRKNGKTFLAVAVALYMLTQDEPGTEVFCGATSEQQADEVFRPARQIVEHPLCTDLARHFKLESMAKRIVCHRNSGFLSKLVYRGTKEGSSPTCAIVDEYHAHDNDRMYQAMRTGQGARRDPLMLIISTTGDSMASPLYAKQKEAELVLSGDTKDDRLFALLYAAESHEQWQEWSQWKLANPNLGVSIQEDFLRAQYDRAMSTAAERNTLLSRHLCIWSGSKSQWLDQVLLDKAVSPIRIQDFAGQNCIISYDLATRLDLAAQIILFQDFDAGEPVYYAFHRSYCPEARLIEPKLAHYRKWEDDGWLIATPGNETDIGRILADFEETARDFVVDEVVFDQVNIAVSMYQPLQEQGYEVTIFNKSKVGTTPPMSEIEGALAAGRLHIQHDPCLLWQLGNAKLKTMGDLKFPEREGADEKIDAVDALIAAIARAMVHRKEPPAQALGAELFVPVYLEMSP